MSTSSHESRSLRILSGPHVGAEMALRPGRYVIGTGDSCDIVLRDPDIAVRHALLSIEDSGEASVEPLQGEIDGVTADGAPVEISDFRPFVLGATTIAIGPTGADWPKIELPAATAATAVVPEGSERTEVARGSPESADTPSRRIRPQLASERSGPASRRLSMRALLLGCALVLVVVLVPSFELGFFTEPAVPETTDDAQAENEPTLQQKVQTVIDRLAHGSDIEVSAAPDADNQLQVVGYVETEHNRWMLMKALEPYRNQLRVQIWSTQLLRESIEQTLAGMHSPLTIEKVDRGKVVLSGLVVDGSTAGTIKASLLRDVPGITDMQLNVVDVSEAVAWLRQEIASEAIPSAPLTIDGSAAGVRVTGSLGSELSDAWQKTVQAFNQRYGTSLAMVDDVRFAEPPPVTPLERLASVDDGNDGSTLAGGEHEVVDGFDFVVRAISPGPPAFVTLGTDEKYLVGSRFPNGMILDRIDADGIVLSNDGKRHLVRIARESGRVTDVQELASE